jgi:hypothetical protein
MEVSITMVVERSWLCVILSTIDGWTSIKIHYVGEVAQDAGGVLREWITELTRELVCVKGNDMEEGKPKHLERE